MTNSYQSIWILICSINTGEKFSSNDYQHSKWSKIQRGRILCDKSDKKAPMRQKWWWHKSLSWGILLSLALLSNVNMSFCICKQNAALDQGVSKATQSLLRTKVKIIISDKWDLLSAHNTKQIPHLSIKYKQWYLFQSLISYLSRFLKGHGFKTVPLLTFQVILMNLLDNLHLFFNLCFPFSVLIDDFLSRDSLEELLLYLSVFFIG